MTFAHPYLKGGRFLCFAHRGGALEAPENSARAFRAALDLGYTHIETDVQATADGRLVVFHDETLDRSTDGAGAIAETPLAAVQEARIAGAEPIMTAEEMLETFPEAHFNVDVKTDAALEPALSLVERTAALDRVCLASESSDRLRRIRARLGPGVCTNAGKAEVARLTFGAWGLPTPHVVAQCAQIPPSWRGIPLATGRFARFCERRGIAVHVWTIDEEAEMRRLIRAGIHGLMTDRPSVLKRIAAEEGVWAGG